MACSRCQRKPPSSNLEDKRNTASVVTEKLSEGGVEPEDYHATLNGPRFLQWIRNRLLPAFEAKYGKRKKMVLILDNASYHHAKDETWWTTSDKNKAELAEYLLEAGIESITDDRGRVYTSEKFKLHAHQGGPPMTKMKEIVDDYIKSHHTNSTVVRQILEEKGHKLLYTPPYESWLQPIELVWARVKHEVAKLSCIGRIWQETQEQTRAALSQIGKDLCSKLIKHTHNLMDKWLKSDDAGSLKHHLTLEALVALSPAQRAKCTDLNVEDCLLVGDAETDEEKEAPKK